MNIPTFDPPVMKENATTTDAKIWDFEYKAMVTRVTLLCRNTAKLFSLLLGKCTPSMIAKHEIRDDWFKMNSGYLVVDLLKTLRDVTYKLEGQNYPYLSLHLGQRDTFLVKQEDRESIIL